MPLNQHAFQTDLEGAPFVWKNKGMKYLGINITSLITLIFNFNGPELLTKMKDDLKRWTVLPISLRGRIETFTMNIVSRIIVNQESSRSYKKLTVPRSQGGLGVPDVYCLSFNARYPLAWAYKDVSTEDRRLGVIRGENHLKIQNYYTCLIMVLDQSPSSPQQQQQQQQYNQIIMH